MWSFAGVEAQIAAFADDIAYDAHDIDDGLRAGLFSLDEIATVPLPGKIIDAIRAAYPGLDDAAAGARADPAIDRPSDRRCRRRNQPPACRARAALGRRRAAGGVARSPGSRRRSARPTGRSRRSWTTRMYRHTRVMQVMDQARRRAARPVCPLSAPVPATCRRSGRRGSTGSTKPSRARRIADFIAGMTDRYALAEHAPAF